MRALSVMQPWASLITTGRKTVELRSRPTSHRGELLICAGVKVDPRGEAFEAGPTGVAVATVRVVGCRRATLEDAGAACYRDEAGELPWAWILADAAPLAETFSVKGQLSLFTVNHPSLPTPAASQLQLGV